MLKLRCCITLSPLATLSSSISLYVPLRVATKSDIEKAGHINWVDKNFGVDNTGDFLNPRIDRWLTWCRAGMSDVCFANYFLEETFFKIF